MLVWSPGRVAKGNLGLGETSAGFLLGDVEDLAPWSVTRMRRCNMEPWSWLRDVLRRIPDITVSRLPQLLPDPWQASRAEERTGADLSRDPGRRTGRAQAPPALRACWQPSRSLYLAILDHLHGYGVLSRACLLDRA